MSKRFLKPSINWSELEKRVPPDQKGKFIAFKAKSDTYFRRVQSYPPEPPKINWDAYQKLVPVPGLVDKLKSEYESFQVPYPTDTLSQAVDVQWSKLQPDIKKYCAELQKEIEKAEKEVLRIKALPSFENMTMEMFFKMFPNQAIDFVNKPSFWPHDPECQIGTEAPEKDDKAGSK